MCDKSGELNARIVHLLERIAQQLEISNLRSYQ